MARELTNPSPEVYGNLDLWVAFSRNKANCALRYLYLRIEPGTELPPDEGKIDMTGRSQFIIYPDPDDDHHVYSGYWGKLPDLDITFTAIADKKLTKLPILGPQFSIEFSIKVKSFPSSGLANIFHFTSTGSECCSVGDRVPAIFLDSKGRLSVAFPLNGDGEEMLKIRNKLHKRKWHRIKIIQDEVFPLQQIYNYFKTILLNCRIIFQ